MSEWQPIETAPKDGSNFIAYDDVNHQLLYTIHWDDEIEGFITDYERWSGVFKKWRPSVESPS